MYFGYKHVGPKPQLTKVSGKVSTVFGQFMGTRDKYQPSFELYLTTCHLLHNTFCLLTIKY